MSQIDCDVVSETAATTVTLPFTLQTDTLNIDFVLAKVCQWIADYMLCGKKCAIWSFLYLAVGVWGYFIIMGRCIDNK